MEKLKIEEIKKIEIEMLLYIDEICKKNNIQYFLDSGTLLGAIRHKGFIPWDDDVDIILFRNDYDKLIKILKADNRFQSISYENSSYVYPFAKITDTNTRVETPGFNIYDRLGIYIDLFPIDNLPKSRINKFIFFNKIWYGRKALNYLAINDINLFDKKYKKVIKRILEFVGIKRINKFIDKECRKYTSIETEEVTTILGSFKKEKILKKEWFLKEEIVPFESINLPIPKGYKEYLTVLYGDYLVLPPKEDQIGHGLIAFKKEKD